MMDRRKFLKYGIQSIVGYYSAFEFGQVIAAMTEGKSRIAVLYSTKYGSTRDTSEWIVEGMRRPVALFDLNNSNASEILSYEVLIVGSGVLREGPHSALIDFLKQHMHLLNNKVIASFLVCGTPNDNEKGRRRIARYFDKLHAPFATPPALSQSFGGRLVIEKLTKEDREALERFYTKVAKRKLTSWDRTDPKLARRFGKKLKIKL